MKHPLFACALILILPLHLIGRDLSPAELKLKEKGRALTIGVVTAHPKEGEALLAAMTSPVATTARGMRVYHRGMLWGFDTVLVGARIGKVAAATTTTALILEHQVDLLLFIGVAGGVDPDLQVGDIVVGGSFLQHDLDSRPLCPKNAIPLLGLHAIEADSYLVDIAWKGSSKFLEDSWVDSVGSMWDYGGEGATPKLQVGLILSGDQFIADRRRREALGQEFPSARCVEMEGAAVAQVAYEYGIPFVVIRTLSDGATERADKDCIRFMNTCAGAYAVGTLKEVFGLFQGAVD